MTKKLEFMCRGNVTRSPTAELIAQNFAEREKIQGIEFSSSGVDVDEINSRSPNPEAVRKIIDLGLKRGFYSPQEAIEAEKLIVSSNYNEKSRLYLYRTSLSKAIAEEVYYRNMALQKLEIIGYPKLIPTQTRKRDVDMGICMEAGIITKASSLLREKVTDIGSYLEKSEIPSGFGTGNLDRYIFMVEKIQEYVPRAINKFLEVRK